MTKEVLIDIQGLQFENAGDDQAADQIQTIYPGEYYYRGNAHYLLYEEVEEESGIRIKNMIKIKDKEITITKKGPFQVQMNFLLGQKMLSDYATPFGNIVVGFDTSDIQIQQQEDQMEVHIEYALEANYQFVADCKITILVRSQIAKI